MNEILEKDNCTGCTACKSICPKNAIIMKENAEGFLYPSINQNKCIDCNLCKKTCPVLKASRNSKPLECYAAYAKDENILLNSSSGGLFTIFANCILEQSGIVIGAAFDENLKLNHIAITSKEELYKLQGSKYLQSNLKDIFLYIKENINDKKILFVGTPCQVAGLRSLISNDNLYCVDLICHGVPSQKMFDKYIKELEDVNNKVVNVNFRDKLTGWDSYSIRTYYSNYDTVESKTKNKYFTLFISNKSLRESCYKCGFRINNTQSDVTIGDFWGIRRRIPEMYNSKGVSAVIVNTKKGQKMFDTCLKEIIYQNCELGDITITNPVLIKSVERPKERTEFFKKLDILNIESLYKTYRKKINYISLLKSSIKNIYNKKRD